MRKIFIFTTLVGVAVFSGALRSFAEDASEPSRAWRAESREGSEQSSRFRASVRDKASRAAEQSVDPPDRFQVESVRNGSIARFTGAAPELSLLGVDGPNRSGIVRVRFKMIRNGETLGEAFATVRGTVRGPALVTVAAAKAGDPIGPGAVEKTDTDLTRLREKPLRALEQLKDRAPVRTLGPGRVLTPSLLKAAPVVRRGETVAMILRRGRLTVNTVGVARTDGAPGETISARNPWTHAELQGEVQPDGTLRVVRSAIPKGARRR